MQHRATTLQRSAPLRAIRIIGLVAAVSLVTTTTRANANQVYKACGKKWTRQAAKLPSEQFKWMMEQRAAEFEKDLDGDGLTDRITMTSTPSFRNCEIKRNWRKKETTVRIDYGNGKSQLFHWIGDHLVRQMTLHPGIGKILVSGVDADGNTASRWVGYRMVVSSPPALLADDLPEARAREEGVTIARID